MYKYFSLIFFLIINLNKLTIIKCDKVESSNFLFNLIKLDLDTLLITNECRNDLRIIENAVRENQVWALKLLDTSGHAENDFVWGNNFWLGSKSGCELLQDPINLYLSPKAPHLHMKNFFAMRPPINISYRITYARHHSDMQVDLQTFDKSVIHIGLCMPKHCTSFDTMTLVDFMISNATAYNEGGSFLTQNLTILSTKNLMLRDDYFNDGFIITFLSLSVFFISMIVLSSIFTAYNSHCVLKENNNNNCELEKQNEKKKERKSILEKIFECFSLSENSDFITSTQLGKDSLDVIHGLRSIGMVWIIAGHIFYYASSAIDNLQGIFNFSEDYFMQPLFTVALSVDSYFVVSGLLLSYLFFQREEKCRKENAAFNCIKTIINRYLRLTPLYMVVMLLTRLITVYLRDTSQYWMTENNDENCYNHWWRNVLYINNLYPMSEMCMSWSWYLATDFQLFCLSTIILAFYKRWKKLCVSLFLIVFAVTTIINGYLGFRELYFISLDAQYQTIDLMYMPPWSRVGAYFIGVLTGWYLSTYERKLNISKNLVALGWVIGPFLNLMMIFGTTKKDLSIFTIVLHAAFGRTIWGIGIAWVIIACTAGRGGIVGKILNGKILIPLSRMSYAAYLINPLVIMFVFMSAELAFHLDFSTLLVMALGIVWVTFTLAYIFMLIFENPTTMLIRTFIEKTK